jgi:hypothetical protein
MLFRSNLLHYHLQIYIQRLLKHRICAKVCAGKQCFRNTLSLTNKDNSVHFESKHDIIQTETI